MAELLIELLSEEIPARMQDLGERELERVVMELLDRELLGSSSIDTFSTPRRLVAVVRGLTHQQASRTIERRGPRADAPEAARNGFLRSLEGLEYTIDTRVGAKGSFLFALITEGRRNTIDILADALPTALLQFKWPKSMRWGSGEFNWVRPLQSILCLFDGKVVPFTLAGIAASGETRGHRFMTPDPFGVADFEDYRVRLRAAKVILSGRERRELIAARAKELAAEQALALSHDAALLEELKGLVEWPVPLLGAIDEDFMAVPSEVLVTTMRNNQKYLTLRQPNGSLARRFVLVANLEAQDGGAAIVAGNERVLRARLWDARFFWDQDRKVPLESRLPKLDQVVFHAELGTQGQRLERLVALSGTLVQCVRGAHRPLAERAALLAKADLVTGMVGEFPELQGIMGGHYAAVQGEPPAVVAAIREHYAPKGPDDACPAVPESVVVALADKLDTLTGFFGAGLRPTGSKDPFALRRAALGVVRIILTNSVRVPLRQIIDQTILLYFGQNDSEKLDKAAELRFFDLNAKAEALHESIATSNWSAKYVMLHDNFLHDFSDFLRSANWEMDHEAIYGRNEEFLRRVSIIKVLCRSSNFRTSSERQAKIQDTIQDAGSYVLNLLRDRSLEALTFITERLKVYLRDQGLRYDVLAAVFAIGDEDDLVRLVSRGRALQAFLDTDDGRNLLAAFRRAANIVAIEERKDGRPYDGHPVAGLLVEVEEEALFAALETAGGAIEAALAREDYAAAMGALASLRGPLDAFFAAVMVNAPEPDLRLNRLLLLARISSSLVRVADFALIEDVTRVVGAA